MDGFRRVRHTGGHHAGICMEREYNLWNHPPYVQRVGAGGSCIFKIFVGDGFGHQSLAVLDGAVDFQRVHVSSEGGELGFLGAAQRAFRIQHQHVGAILPEHAVGGGRAAVARGGYKYCAALTACLAVGGGQQAGYEACAVILEGESRAVEKFESIAVASEVHQGRVGSKSIIDCLLDFSGRYLISQKRARHHIGDVAQAHFGNIIEKSHRYGRNLLWHVQSAAGRNTPLDGFKASYCSCVGFCACV